ncbi:MAG: HAD family phosphatase [Thermomicrobiales bacterium]|nr:HAD family phosphatase [Thermomicrobiales bacterium]
MTTRPPMGAVIFDLDGLLVDSEPLAAMAMQGFLAGFGVAVDPVVQAQMLGRRLPEAIRIAQASYGLPGTLDDLTDGYSEARMAALRGAVRPMPGARAILDWVRSTGLPVALATSGMRTHADISLSETGLADAFDFEVTGDQVERGKPAPDLFLAAAKGLGVEPNASVVLEDSPLGVEAAITAGMRAIAVQNGRERMPDFTVEPTVSVSSLFDAKNWLKAQLF